MSTPSVGRVRIHVHVRAQPGATAAELGRAAGMHHVVVAHHLRGLLRDGLVVAIEDERSRVRMFFDRGHAPRAGAAPHLALLRDPTRRAVAEWVSTMPQGARQAELIQATGRSQRLVAYHLHRLAEQGLVEVEGRRPKTFRATPRLVEALGLVSGAPPG